MIQALKKIQTFCEKQFNCYECPLEHFCPNFNSISEWDVEEIVKIVESGEDN